MLFISGSIGLPRYTSPICKERFSAAGTSVHRYDLANLEQALTKAMEA